MRYDDEYDAQSKEDDKPISEANSHPRMAAVMTNATDTNEQNINPILREA